MKVRPLPAPLKIIDKMKYNIIFKGTSYKNRCIEVYLPEYKHSQFILKHPVGSKYLFGLTSDEFWRSHPDLEKEVREICFDIAFKHLSFVVGWDFRETQNDYTWWSYAVKEWKEEGYITVTNEQFDNALSSFYNKYVREKGQRVYQYVPKKVYTYQDKFDLLNLAIDLAGDGGPDPFTEEERLVLNDFMLEIKNKFINKD